MSHRFVVESINISREKGTTKTPVDRIHIGPMGCDGDAHTGYWHRQISLLGMEQIERFSETIGRRLRPGEFAENLSTRGLDLSHVAVMDRLILGGVTLEVTQIGKECHSGCAIFEEVGACIMPKEGIFARVIHDGDITMGMTGEFIPRPLKIHVITLSDRASQGVYTDRSGPRIVALLEEYFANHRYHQSITTALIPDDPEKLMDQLCEAEQCGADFIITTGSTGIGSRDIAPETVTDFCDKLIPGIMEHIRVKYGTRKPGALLSRGVAGIKGTIFIMTFPGSVKACEEYFTEWQGLWEHILRMVHEIDNH